MSAILTFRPAFFVFPARRVVAPKPMAKSDWPLMSDVATFRGDVPEALIRWCEARGETPPVPLHNCPTD